MAKGKDPAFLFYPGDASEDTQFMNRLERGCYFDLLKAQKKFRKFSLDLIKKVLGQDFEQCWPAIESVLKKDGNLYFIEWADDAIENRAEHSARQKKRIEEYWKRKRSEDSPDLNHGNTTVQPEHNHGYSLENENGSGNENAIETENGIGGPGEREKVSRATRENGGKTEVIDFTQPDVEGDELIFPIDTKPIRELWGRWKKYRWEQYRARYGMMGEQADLKRLEGFTGPQIEKTILTAIANNWKNLYPEHNRTENGSSKSKHQRTISDLQQGWAKRYGNSDGAG